MANLINSPESPALPDPQQGSVFTNVLRLFFNRLTSAFGSLTAPDALGGGGKVLYFPTALFYSTEHQKVSVVNTPIVVTYNLTYISKGIRVENNSRIVVDCDGVYNFQGSFQLLHHAANAANVYLWIRKNGVDTEWSTHKYTLSGSSAETEANWNFNYDMVAGDYIEMVFNSDDIDAHLHPTAPTSPHVGIPSVVMAVNFASNY